jgi:hypothetical protein
LAKPDAREIRPHRHAGSAGPMIERFREQVQRPVTVFTASFEPAL